MRSLLFVAALAVTALVSSSAFAQGRWSRIETPGFVIYASGSQDRARDVAADLEAFDALLRRFTGAPAARSPTKLDVFLFGRDEFQETFPGANDNIRGFYSAGVEQIAAYAIFRDGWGLGAQEVLFHEYAHHFMYQYFNNAYPAWYVEGFAEFISTATIGSERIVLGRSSEARAHTLFNGSWLPMEELITATTWQLDEDERAAYYAQAWLFTHYIVMQRKNAQFEAYVRALRRGQEPAAAFSAGFGVTPSDMQRELRAYLRGAPNALALTRPARVAPADIRVTRLPASADRLLPIAARVARDTVREADEQAVLRQVRTLVGAAPTDDFALRALARAEIAYGSPLSGRALLQPHVEAHPEDVEALYLVGRSYVQEAEAAEGAARAELLAQARRQFSRAYRSNENHVPSLYGYVDSYSGVGMDQDTYANYLNVLLLARRLAPQVDAISLRAAEALIAAERRSEAIPILRALAYDPHGGGNAERAQQLLSEAEGAQAAAQ